ncbi:MAG: cyclic nucleotide-binding domain-containing protein [Spirochaetales bacterium]|nr:cyclic nucleotide-binding domain-containing protein [Spirochaetales bacterium]
MAEKEILKGVSLFKSLSLKHLKAIEKACVTRGFQPGEKLIEQGAQGVGLFIIEMGKVKVTKTRDDGTSFIIAEHGPGEVIGEMSILDGAPRTATVEALEPTTCWVLSSWSFQSIMEAHPEVAVGILPMVVKRFRETNEALLRVRGE